MINQTMKIAMRKIFFLMMLGCIFVACKSENTNGDAAVEPQYQASVSVHRTYSGSELRVLRNMLLCYVTLHRLKSI